MAKIKRVPKKPYMGGPEVCKGIAWTHRRLEVVEREDGKCERCKRPAPFHPTDEHPSGHVHHKNGTRGLGGGKRDDRLENLELLCFVCHLIEHEKQNKPSATIH